MALNQTGLKKGNAIITTTTWDPGSIADGAADNTTVSVSGVEPGDLVSVSHDTGLAADIILTGEVTSSDTVTASLVNQTGSSTDIGSGVLRAEIRQYN